MNGSKLLIIAVLAVLLFACNKNKQHPVPSIPFDITIDFNLPSYSALQGVGGYAYVNNVGSKGVIVYRRGIEDFVAFDRHSPADAAGDCATPLYPSSDNFLELLDDCNDAKFSLYDGSPIQGSDFGLRSYPFQWNGDNLLRIYN